MLKTLISKEILNNLLNYRFILAYFVCTVLLVSSAAVLYADYLARKHDYELNTNTYRSRISGAMEDYQYFSNLWVARPVRLLSVFAAGGERDPNTTAQITVSTSPDFRTELRRNPLRSFFPTLDTVFVVGIIMSLLVFMLTFDTVSGEREEGTLKVLLSGPVPRDVVFLAKWIGGFICLLVPLLTSMLLMAIVLVFSSTVSVSADEWLRLAGIAGICMLYVAVVFSLSLMVSILARQSATIMLALLVLWATLIVAVPALSTPVAHLVVGPPSVEQAETACRYLPDTVYWGSNRIVEECVKQTCAAKGLKPGPNLSEPQREQIDRIGFLCHQKTRPVLTVDTIAAVENARARSVDRVERLAGWITRISPYGCLQQACISLAGTGGQYENRLLAALQTYNRAQIEFTWKQIEVDRPDMRWWQFSGDGAPRFQVPRPDLLRDLTGLLVDAGLLILMGVLFFLAGFGSFVRSEVA
jgi:ABC-type transport system involved in multi-copper enzyme maturation permease subunit